MTPLFLTHKLTVNGLRTVCNVFDFQLRDHLLTVEDLYLSMCKCRHAHYKRSCRLVTTAYCDKFRVANERFVNYKSLLFHPAAECNRLAKCCPHVHEPPCGRCIGCRTTSACIVQSSFECNFTTDATCTSSGAVPPHFTTQLKHGHLVREHVYNTRSPAFHFCRRHVHVHSHELYGAQPCYVQTRACCEHATLYREFDSTFVITVLSGGNGRKEYVIYDPSLWHDQSANHFVSFLRAVINLPDLVEERYRHFESAHFKVSNIRKYKSGKQSIVRLAVTGFETKGIYQTANISCTLPSGEVLIPQKIYDLLSGEYDLTLVTVKRDPSITQTCMFVCRAVRNTDPEVDTLVISDAIAKPLNQDQDGDKNGVYALALRSPDGYDRRESFLFRLARLELATAYRTDKTLIATPRYSLSEYNRLVVHRKRDELKPRSEFMRRTYDKGIDHMIEAGCGYLREEYEEFCRLLVEINSRKETSCVTLDDVEKDTGVIRGIVQSGAKGHDETLDMLYEGLRSERTLWDQKSAMVEQMNRYISSSQTLRHTGRSLFVSLYAAHDLTTFLGCVYVNKRLYADYRPFASVGPLMFNKGSLDEFIADLEREATATTTTTTTTTENKEGKMGN